jgi:hypothetical protein
LFRREKDGERKRERESVVEVYMKESRRGGGGGMTVKEASI